MAALDSDPVQAGAIPDHLKRKIARDKLMAVIGECWGLSLMAAVIGLLESRGGFALFGPNVPSITLAASTGEGYLILALIALAVAGVGVALTRYRPPLFFSAMVLGTSAVLVLSIMGLRCGWVMSGSMITIRPAEFWKPDKVFSAKDVTAIQRGCYISSVKGVGPSYNPILSMNCVAVGQFGSWDANQSFTSLNSSIANLAHFVDAISAFQLRPDIPSETVGAAVIHGNPDSEAARRALVEERQCVGYFTKMLDPMRASEFRKIVGAE